MNINEYQQLALKTANNLNDKKGLVVNGALGLTGESGEVADLIKKHLFLLLPAVTPTLKQLPKL